MAQIKKAFTGDGDNGKDHFFKDRTDTLRLTVDFDDVDHFGAACLTRKMLTILNDHWDNAEYTLYNPVPFPDGLTETKVDGEGERRHKAGRKLMETLSKEGK